MLNNIHRFGQAWRRLACGLALVAGASGVLAQGNDAARAEAEQAWKAAQASAQQGPTEIRLGEQATLKLPAKEVFVPQPAAGQLMRAMGNTADSRLLGLVMPVDDDKNWMVVAEYEPSGYIRDNDAKDWNVDDLFKSLKEGTEQANEERVKRGFPALEVTEWVERPKYDAATHRLVWSMAARHKDAPADAPQTINYNTYALGREGYISLNLLTDKRQVEADKPAVQTLLSNLAFTEGKRYADFNASTDKVAEYGLAALVAGVAAKKLGFFALAAAFLAKFAKVILVALGGFGYAMTKWFRRKPADPGQPK